MVDERLKIAERLGADHVIDMRQFKTAEERVKEVQRLTNGLGGDVVVEAVGISASVPEGIDMTRRGGKFVEVGHYTNPGPVLINPHTICFKDMDILGSYTYSSDTVRYSTGLDEARSGPVALDEIVTHKFHVSEAQKSIDTLKARQGIKHALMG